MSHQPLVRTEGLVTVSVFVRLPSVEELVGDALGGGDNFAGESLSTLPLPRHFLGVLSIVCFLFTLPSAALAVSKMPSDSSMTVTRRGLRLRLISTGGVS